MLNQTDFDWLQSTPSNVLTWYSPEGRLEFTGAVMARWLAKTANYVVEMFGEGAARVALDLPDSWRTLVWVTGAGFAGASTSIIKADLASVDLFVTADEERAGAAIEADPGLVVLLQDLGMMSLGWGGELPDGVEDAISEVSIQPDVPVFGGVLPAGIPEGEAASSQQTDMPSLTNVTEADASGIQPAVIEGSPYIAQIWQAWRDRRPAIWIEDGLDTERILRQERLI